jgi:hypothetical protein
MLSPSTIHPTAQVKDESLLKMRIFCISVRDKIFPGDAHLLDLRCINTVENIHEEKRDRTDD